MGHWNSGQRFRSGDAHVPGPLRLKRREAEASSRARGSGAVTPAPALPRRSLPGGKCPRFWPRATLPRHADGPLLQKETSCWLNYNQDPWLPGGKALPAESAEGSESLRKAGRGEQAALAILAGTESQEAGAPFAASLDAKAGGRRCGQPEHSTNSPGHAEFGGSVVQVPPGQCCPERERWCKAPLPNLGPGKYSALSVLDLQAGRFLPLLPARGSCGYLAGSLHCQRSSWQPHAKGT